MLRAGVIAREARMDNTTGVTIEAPFFDPINAIEETVRSDATWGISGAGHFTSQKVTASTQYATITHRGFMFSCDTLSQLGIGEDPLAHFTAQLADDLNRKRSLKAYSMLTGIFAGALAAHSISIARPTAGVTDETNFLNAASVTAAKYLLGERAQDVTTIVVASPVAAYLEKVGMTTAFPASPSGFTWGTGGIGVTDTVVRNFAGLNVVIDDNLLQFVTGAVGAPMAYPCYLMGPGALKEGWQMPVTMRAAFNIPSDQFLTSVRYSHVYHLPGVTWQGATHNPENPALRVAGNWAQAYSDARLIPLTRLIVNTPFGGIQPLSAPASGEGEPDGGIKPATDPALTPTARTARGGSTAS
jgi:hypothetical protein